MLELLAVLLLVAGLALGGAAWHWARYARRIRALHTQLLQLAPGEPQGPRWPAALWTALRAAGVSALQWQGEWCGRPLQGGWGPAAQPPRWQAEIVAGADVNLTLRASWPARRGEGEWLAHAACELLRLHVQAAASADSAWIDGALRQRTHHALLWMHDVRNLLQWLRWQAEDWSALAQRPQGCQDLCQRLADSAGVLKARCERLIQASAAQTEGDAPPVGSAPSAVVDLAELVRQAARFHGVQVRIEGTAHSACPAEAWLGILDELMHNARRHAPAQAVEVQLAEDAEGVTLTLTLPLAAWGCDPAMLFVPLARSPRSQGWGLGLYLARRQARRIGGDLAAVARPSAFRLWLPHQPAQMRPDVVRGRAG